MGDLALSGIDPRTWDLNRMLAAFEALLKQRAKDDAEWQRTYQSLTAEPPEERRKRREETSSGARPVPKMSVGDAEAMLARFAASDAAYGVR